ncbi:MAG TPA: hypothetical protein VJ306_06605 [Pyrinomonadaceae bacterium]|nr:hypothetical protein [Pyrinomonadaceae bacterium]
MYSEPIILPLNADGQLYALQDEHGRIVGTGTREICHVLLMVMKNQVFNLRPPPKNRSAPITSADSKLTN